MTRRYALTAAGLGAGWFVVLLVPAVTREWLLAEPIWNLIALIVTSVVVAATFRRWIGRAMTFGDHLARAVVIPYAGCLVYLTLWAAIWWSGTLTHGGLANLHDTGALYLMGLTAAAYCCFIVIPYGLLCQYAMNAALPPSVD